MKSRSNRIPASSAGDSKDDEWVEEEESWTVDCVCGVNFDDGEEMVNCDECGVWVHTRCSRYVKSDKSFACDKCKNNININNNSGGNNGHIRNNDSEETEVAQLLVELPTKTLNRMDNPLPPLTAPTSSFRASAFVPTHRPFRLWTDVPIDDRVHVQGVPGGDPALFSGVSSVFGPQLWKCSGYIPKKFNFRYREFPYWVEEEVPEKDSGEKVQRRPDNVVDNGAGVLFSLARDNVVPPDDDGRGSDGFVSLKKTSKSEVDDSGVLTPQTEMSKDIKPSLILFGKRKKEDLCMSEDRRGKKVARMLDKAVGDYNNKNRLRAPGIDRGPTIAQADTECTKGGYTTCHLPASQLPRDSGVYADAVDTQKSNLASCQDYSEKSSFDGSGVNSSSRTVTKEANGGRQVPHKLEESSETVRGVPSVLGCDDSVGGLENEEVLSVTAATANDIKGVFSTNGVTDLHLSGEFSEDVATAGQEAMDSGSAPDSSINLATSCLEIHAKSKTELTIGDENLNVELSSNCETKLSSSGASVHPREISANITNNTISRDCNRQVENAVRRSVVVDLHKQRDDGKLPLGHCQSNHDSSGSYDSLEAKKISPVVGPNADFESQKSHVTVASPRVAAGEVKVTVSSASSFSAPLATPMFKLSASENRNGVSSQSDCVDGKQNLGPESSLAGNQNISGASTLVVMDETRHEKAKKLVKELPKSGFSSVPKSSQLKKLSHTAVVSKRTSSDSKDSMLDSSLSPAQTPIASPSTADLANVQQIESTLDMQKTTALQSESASSMQKKVIGPVLYQKGDKFNQSVSQFSSKVNNITHNAGSSNSHATLSDEELALLLHQELNSSPRVPRVPRMRHTGSLPQLTSPTATSTLMKRTSSTGGKDHGSTSRRKTKDLAKDGSHGSMDMDDEHKKLERASSSIDNSRQDSAFASDSIRKREADSGSATAVYSLKRTNAPSRTAAGGGLSSQGKGNASNYSFTQHSPKISSDDEKGIVARRTHRTLPGLLAEIMSEGRRMTYEELCNSVLPHWPYLRKHNGERYAYSSHSQAVLDCLRNRNEWARLVDRGPKTSGGRKRRKPDAGATGVESEDNDDIRDRSSKDGCRSKAVESRHEEFPKGKRKARKRRRLALQGRVIKDVRRRQKTDDCSDDEDGSFSDSSGEIMLSEDEI